MTITKFEDGSTLKFLSVAAEILTVANMDPKSMTLEGICRNHKTPLSPQECLENLCELRLLQYDDKENTFRTTRKGKDFLEDYERLRAQLI